MAPRFAARLAAVASCLLVVVASTGSAAPLDFAGQLPLTIQIASQTLVFTLEGGGGVIVNPSSAGLHLTAASLQAGALTVAHSVALVTDPFAFPIAGIQVTAANGSGLIDDTSGRLRGAIPLAGVAKLCLFSPCSETVANLLMPLSPIGRGGSAHVTGAVNLTLVGAPWTTGTANVGAATVRGGAHGPASATSSTAQTGGDVNLVTPIFISSNLSVSDARIWSGFARLGMSFGGLAVIGCADGIDNDGDGLVDFPDDPGCTRATDFSERESGHGCDDGIDNDQDGLVDFPADPGCSSVLDETETTQLACDDGVDNDGDGLIDFPSDPGCASIFDDSERDPALACDDGVDNDGDGKVDYPADRDCDGVTDPSEFTACSDGLDNDGDGAVDLDDPGCPFPEATLENPQCDDGIDNDGDGLVDFDDPACSRAWPYWETKPACGLGVELTVLIPLVSRLRARRRRREA